MGKSTSTDSGGGGGSKKKSAASVAGQIRRTQYEIADQYKRTTGGTYNVGQAPVSGIQPADPIYRRNLQLAETLDVRGRDYSVPIPGTGGAVLSGIGSFSQRNQAKQLRAGGIPVFGDLGGNRVKNRSVLVGVVSRGFIPGTEVYSGRSEFNPLIREDSGFDVSSRSYGTQRAGIRSSRDSSVKLKRGFGDTSSDGPIQATNPDSNVSGAVEVASSTTASGPTGAQRALGLLDTSGGQKSRYFMGKTSLS